RLAPDRFMGLGMIASQHRADSDEARQNRYKTAEQVREQGAEAVTGMMDKLFAATADTTPDESVRDIIRQTKPEGIIGALHAMAARPDSTDTLKTITVPALVL